MHIRRARADVVEGLWYRISQHVFRDETRIRKISKLFTFAKSSKLSEKTLNFLRRMAKEFSLL